MKATKLKMIVPEEVIAQEFQEINRNNLQKLLSLIKDKISSCLEKEELMYFFVIDMKNVKRYGVKEIAFLFNELVKFVRPNKKMLVVKNADDKFWDIMIAQRQPVRKMGRF